MTSIVYIISHIDKSLEFEWVAQQLDTDCFKLHFILLNPGDSALEQFLKEQDIPVKRIHFTGKKHFPKALFLVWFWLLRHQPDIVHTHLLHASLVGLLAARWAGIPQRIYTRHHATFHHKYYPRGVKYDQLNNRLATEIVAISSNVKQVLTQYEGVASQKITTIPHGFDLQRFQEVSAAEINRLQQKYNPHHQQPVIGVIARYLKLKGFQYIIPAFKKLLDKHPEALLIIANAQGPDQNFVQKKLQTIPASNYLEITFEEDIFALYQLFDIYVHVPINAQVEAFGQTYIEAMAAGIPSIFTRSGIGNEVLEHQKNAYVVPYKDATAIYEAMKDLLNNKELRQHLSEQGPKTAKSFPVQKMVNKLERLYEK